MVRDEIRRKFRSMQILQIWLSLWYWCYLLLYYIKYHYYCINLQSNRETKGIIYSVYLTSISANFPAITSIPSWVSFDFNAQEISITVPKNYEYEKLSILFEMRYPLTASPEIYQQIISFPLAICSLSYKLGPHLIISTPDKNNIQIKAR